MEVVTKKLRMERVPYSRSCLDLRSMLWMDLHISPFTELHSVLSSQGHESRTESVLPMNIIQNAWELDELLHIYKPSAQEVDAGGLGLQGEHWLNSKALSQKPWHMHKVVKALRVSDYGVLSPDQDIYGTTSKAWRTSQKGGWQDCQSWRCWGMPSLDMTWHGHHIMNSLHHSCVFLYNIEPLNIPLWVERGSWDPTPLRRVIIN